MIVLNFDGGARPTNPGPAACAWVVLDEDGVELQAGAMYLGARLTNNEAEYLGLIGGLAAAWALGADEVEVRSDSQLVVKQMTGEWRIRSPHLRQLAADALRRADFFSSVTYTWNPREDNSRADALCTAAIEAAS